MSLARWLAGRSSVPGCFAAAGGIQHEFDAADDQRCGFVGLSRLVSRPSLERASGEGVVAAVWVSVAKAATMARLSRAALVRERSLR
jgi:hypothetical protein